ncbi:cytochrome b-c1 complex subunit 10-like [Chrysoperla carnea]|uniref:cytochrome b-c1 complex subunit 10-like n=1 Tax=Chrysoperla carnea TaxID=189513 RepID=UPI001D064569|nr:cytochrome b-c1 complex subunit 10-like [Chrysoperla carnea]
MPGGGLPGPLKQIGKKHIEVASAFMPSASIFGAAGGAFMLYFTDWKAVLQYVPFYGGKFKTDDADKPAE